MRRTADPPRGSSCRGALLVAAVLAGSATAAQESAPSEPRFEIASVKANRSGEFGSHALFDPGGRYSTRNYTAKRLIQHAYEVESFQVLGGPEWIDKERFDIVAKAPMPKPSPAEARALVRNLLQDRFGLVTRITTREAPVFALLVARSDRRLGPALKPSDEECERSPGPRPLPPSSSAPLTCGIVGGRGHLSGRHVTMDVLARALAPHLERPVLNRTQLTGRYSFELDYQPEFGAFVASDLPADQRPADTRASLFAAISEQLGLRLDSQRGQVPFLLIEKIAAPTPD